MTSGNERNVFVNCPFDAEYQNLFTALIFTVYGCGFTPRCALEEDNAGEVRFDKILRIMRACPYGIHDISRTDLDTSHRLPRFNMPFELGLFLGILRASARRPTARNCLILDRERYRYQKYLSDIAGQDIRAHRDEPAEVIGIVRDWFRTANPQRLLPGKMILRAQFTEFSSHLVCLCEEKGLGTPTELAFADCRFSHTIG